MLAGQLGRQRIVDAGAAASRLAVDGDGNADARAAHGDSALGLTGCDRAGELRAIFGIIDAFGAVGAEVGHVMTLLAKPRGKLVLEQVSGMVGGEGDAHGA